MSDCLRYGGVGLECATVKLNPGVPRTLCPVCETRYPFWQITTITGPAPDRYCRCADPEHCKEAVPGYICRRTATPAGTLDVQELVARLALVEAQLKVERAKTEAIQDSLTRLRDLLTLIDKLGGV